MTEIGSFIINVPYSRFVTAFSGYIVHVGTCTHTPLKHYMKTKFGYGTTHSVKILTKLYYRITELNWKYDPAAEPGEMIESLFHFNLSATALSKIKNN